MEIVNNERLMPMTELLKLMYTIDYTQTRRRKKYINHLRKVKVISGDAIPGKKVYTEDYTEDGSSILSIRTKEYSMPFVLRTADDSKDTYKVDSNLLEKNGVNGYKIVVEIVDIVEYFSEKSEEKIDSTFNSEIIVGW